MGVLFPTVEFFNALNDQLAARTAATQDVDASDAYCGLAVGDALFVLEFDAHTCPAVVSGGNPLDLDFVLAAPPTVWRDMVEAIRKAGAAPPDQTLAALIDAEAIRVQSEYDDGDAKARAALGMLQALLDQCSAVDVSFV